MKELFIVCAFGALILNGAVDLQSTNRIERLTKATTYAICNQSRQDSKTISERTCGDIQDQTHTEFLCSKYNSSANNTCWGEVK